ncbi:amino acid transporter AVT1B isoform X2 [Venturia canescens]|uniref:amino acid transporter AVT1B isoform X2 n=1 Tax=Venturia canescens TaxID=32260 RepID=UPI001C9BCE23|nr:amino acid transporter AVT1B isoform X2 [Venturia canescens]
MNRERIPLLYKDINSGLSLIFATLCIVDIFGVFPIIALPRAIVQCGLLGIPLVLVVFGLQIYTAALLGKSWIIASSIDPQISRKNRYPLAAVTELTLGPRVRTLVNLLLDFTVFGCGIPNLLVASQNLQIFGLKISSNNFNLSFCYWLLVVGVFLCPLMWLGSPRDMKWLAVFSSAAVGFTAILIWWCIVIDDRVLSVAPVPTSPTWDKFISGYGMLAFQFDVHPTLMTVQVDMRQPRDIDKAVILSFFISGSLFGVTAGLAVWRYGASTTANILQVVDSGYAIRAAILIAALQLCFSSAIGHSALFQNLEDRLRVNRSFGWKRCAMRSAVVFLGVAIGESVPRFDIVMALIGGTLTGPLVFILPPLIYARARALKNRLVSRSPNLEIVSPTQRCSASQTFITDPRIHSQSVFHAFINDDNVNRNGYSYVYYDDDDDDDDDDSPDGLSSELENERSIVKDLGPTTTEKAELSHPRFVDASKPEKILRIKSSVKHLENSAHENRKIDFHRFLDWFGYFIVAIGIIITISSTYINIKNTIRYVDFTPPCIINATVAANVLGLA